jgi:uncharacterized protein DUF6166
VIITGEYTEQDWYGTVTVDGRVLTPERSQAVFNHSPDGFSWGYSGSGCAQLALAILLDVGLSAEDAVRLYQDFKRDVIAPLPRGSFAIALDVGRWIDQHSLKAH